MSAEHLYYGRTVIGELPAGWGKAKTNTEFVDVLGGFSCPKSKTVATGVPHLRPHNVGTDGEVILSDATVYIPPGYREDLERYYLMPGDVLFNNTNSVELVGKTAIVRKPMEVAFSNHINRLRVKDRERLEPRWLALYLRHLQQKGFFSTHCNKWIGQAGFSVSSLANVEIPLPSLVTQRRIVARIEALFAELREARRLHEEVVADTGRLMEAVLAEVFGGVRRGFEVANIPPGEIVQIGDICDLRRGKFSHRPRNDPQFFGGPYPWLQINNIPKDYSKFITTQMDTLNEAGLAISRMFPKGTMVISIAATIGAVGILSFDACFPDSLVGINAKPEIADELDMGFLYWQLSFVKEHLEAIAPYAAQRNINLQILGKLQIWLPSKHVQQQINARLDAVQQEIAGMQKAQAEEAALLEEMEQAILAQAFRGEL